MLIWVLCRCHTCRSITGGMQGLEGFQADQGGFCPLHEKPSGAMHRPHLIAEGLLRT